jgi:hypothetical protein
VQKQLEQDIKDPALSRKIQESVWPDYRNNIRRSSTGEEFQKAAMQLKMNIGLELTREIARTQVLPEAGSSLSEKEKNTLQAQIESDYRSCIAKSAEQIKPCTLLAIRKGVLSFSEVQLRAQIAKNMKDAAQARKVHDRVWPVYERRVLQSSTAEEFQKAAKELTSDTAMDIININIAENLKDTLEKKFKPERDSVYQAVKADLRKCLDRTQDKISPANLRHLCSDNARRTTSESIALIRGNWKIQSLFDGAQIPSEAAQIQSTMKSCIRGTPGGPDLEREIGRCLTSYSLNLTEVLGSAKLHQSLISSFGQSEATEKTAQQVIHHFKNCLAPLNASTFDSQLLSQIDHCTDGLREDVRKALGERILTAFGNPKPNAADARSKTLYELATKIPCLDALVPSATPEKNVSQAGVDVDRTLAALSKYVTEYVDYNPERAHQDVSVILDSLIRDLNTVSPLQAKLNLIDRLSSTGAFTQILNSVIHSTLVSSLNSAGPDLQLPSSITQQLTSPKLVTKILSSPRGEKIRQQALQTLVRPILIHGTPIKSLATEQSRLTRQIANLLVDSPEFGDVLIDTQIQSSVDQELQKQGRIARFLADQFYNTDWSKVRNTPRGRAAQTFVREAILRPTVLGVRIPDKDLQSARQLVLNAIQGT